MLMETPLHASLNLTLEQQLELDVITSKGSKVMSQTWKLMGQILSSWAVFAVAIVLLDTYTHAGKLSTFASFLVGLLTGVAICLLVLLLHVSQEAMDYLKVESGVIKTMGMCNSEYQHRPVGKL